MATPATSSAPSSPPPNPPFTAPVPVHILENNVLHRPEPHHLAHLSDIYLLPCSASSPCPHPPTCETLVSSARIRLQLDRLPPTSLPADLDAAVAAFEHPSITSGFALRVTGTTRASRASIAKARKSTTRVLVAPTEALRDDWLKALRLQLAPASIILAEFLAVARGPASHGVSARDARRALPQVTSGAGTILSVAAPVTGDGGQVLDRGQVQGGRGGQGVVGDDSAGAVLYAERAIELVKRSGASSNFSTTCLQALHDVVSVGDVDVLSRSFGGVALVGPVLVLAGVIVKSILMLSLAEAELPNLVSMRGRIEFVARMLFVIAYDIVVMSSRGDVLVDEFVEDVLANFVDCAGLAADVERHILQKRIWRARHVDDVDGLRARLERLETSLKFSRHAKFATGLQVQLAQFAQFGDRLGLVENLEQDNAGRIHTCIVGVEELKAQLASANVGEAYSPVFHRVPRVPQHVVHDGIPQLQPLLEVVRSGGGVFAVSGGPPTQSSTGSNSSVSSYENAHSVAIHGWGGVGKTLACVIVARDKAVRSAFPGGVVFLKFGEQVMDADVVTQLRVFVLRSGGGPEGKRIVDAIDKVEPTRAHVSRVVGLVADWVEGRHVLFIADNLFYRAHGLPWAEELAALAESPGSALLYSTRRSDLAEFAPTQQRFVFECVKDLATAREIFFGYAGLEQSEPVRDAFQSATIDLILSTCAGWHLALKMAGMLVRKLRCNWAKVKKRLDKQYLLKVKRSEGGVGVIMSVSLKLLGELPADGLEGLDVPLSAFEDPGYFERIYRTLAVLSKVKSVPLSLLPLVFGVADEDAESLAWLFHDAGLATVEKSVEFDSGEGTGTADEMFYLHDLQLQFASDLCASSSVPDASLASQHWLFLSQCCTLSAGAGRSVAEHNWSMFCSAGSTPRDEYIRNHLFWHLAAASEYRPADVKAAVLFILSDFAWLRGRICTDGFMSVVWDIKIVLAVEETCRFSGEEKTTLKTLRQAVMEMGGGVSLDFDGTFAAALIQRAGQMSNRTDSVFPDAAFSKRLAESAESDVRGAWLRPLSGCSREFKSDARVLDKVNVGTNSSLYAVAGLGDDKHVVSAGGDGKFGRLRVHKNEDLDAVLDWNGRCSKIRTIAVARNACDGRRNSGISFTIFSGGDDEDGKGCVRFWEIVVNAAGVPRLGEEGVVGECGEFVRTVSVSDDGLRLAAGCQNGLVFIWNRVNSQNKYAFNLVTSFLCGASHRIWSRERSWVRAAVSSSGSWVVAGTWAGDICFWEDRGLASEGSLMRVASTRPWESDGKLQSILFIDGDSSAVVFFTFPAGFEIWNLSTRSLCAARKALDGLDLLLAVDVAYVPLERGAQGGGTVSQTRFLVAAGYEEGGQFVLLEFDSLNGGYCTASYDIKALACAARYVSIGGARRAVAACRNGVLLLLDVSGRTDNSLSGMDKQEVVTAFSDMEVAGDAEWSLAKICAVAVLPKRGVALAGHDDGSISMWCVKSGNYKGRFEKANAKQVLCLDVSENENMVVSGHAGGNIIVWHVDHWYARLAMHANARGIISLTISADDSRIISVDEVGDVRSWDAMVGGDSAWVVSSALGFSGIKYIAHRKRACRPAISRDGKLFLWARIGSLGHWMAKLIDLQDGREVKSMTDDVWSDGFGFYRFISDCLERDGMKIGLGWRFGSSIWSRFIELQTETGGEGTVLKISPGGIISNYPPVLHIGGSCVRCFLETSTMAVLRDAEFDFGKTAGSFAGGWMPQDGNSSRQVVVACWIAHSNRPAILRYIPAKF